MSVITNIHCIRRVSELFRADKSISQIILWIHLLVTDLPQFETWIPDTLGTDAIITDNLNPSEVLLDIGICQGTSISQSNEILHIQMGCGSKES